MSAIFMPGGARRVASGELSGSPVTITGLSDAFETYLLLLDRVSVNPAGAIEFRWGDVSSLVSSGYEYYCNAHRIGANISFAASAASICRFADYSYPAPSTASVVAWIMGARDVGQTQIHFSVGFWRPQWICGVGNMSATDTRVVDRLVLYPGSGCVFNGGRYDLWGM